MAVSGDGGGGDGGGEAAPRLEVLDWAGPTRWRWRLTTASGAFLADHAVELDGADGRGSSAWEGFTNLDWHLRWQAAVDRRLESEAELLAGIGEWITDRALGRDVVAKLVARPGPVHLIIPPEAQVLAFRPWQAARIRGRTLAASKVTFVTDPVGRTPAWKRPVDERLRMLAVFSLPEGTGALNLRRERYELARMVERIATENDRAIELRVLQYGATRDRLEEALLEDEGWDVLHVSGHGLPAGLVLEDDRGQRDVISTADLVDLIDAGSERLKLVTLSACESAALSAQDHLRLLGLVSSENRRATTNSGDPGSSAPPEQGSRAGPARPDDASNGEERSGGLSQPGAAGARPDVEADLSVLATALADRLDVGVLAMRYPVSDGFATDLANRFYDLVLGKGQPVDRALGLALPRVLPSVPSSAVPALSVVTPALFGSRCLGLRLTAPEGQPVVFQAEREKLARFPGQPGRFVGRVGAMTRAASALAPRSGVAGVVFHGMAGAGKTACALELAYTLQSSFQLLVWHQAPTQDQDITAAFTTLAQDLEAQIPGLQLLHLTDDVAALRAFLPTLSEFLERHRVLVVLDNLESLLTGAGGWRDDRWRLLVEALAVPSGLSRLVLTSRTRPAVLPPGVRVEAVHALSLEESVLLAREWPHLRALIDAPDEGRGGEATGRGLAARVLQVVQGHPKLIELADGLAADPAVLVGRLGQVDQTWLARGVRLEEFLETGDSVAGDEDYFQVLDTWTRGAAGQLPAASGVLFTVLAGLEDADRVPFVVDEVWPVVWRELGLRSPNPWRHAL